MVTVAVFEFSFMRCQPLRRALAAQGTENIFMKVQEKFENELKALESSIVDVFRSEPSLLDSQVARAVKSMVALFKSKVKGKLVQEPKLDSLDLHVFTALNAATNEISSVNSELSDEDLLQCLKVIEKSIPRWTKQLGRQGYLNFVSQYF
ncbi:TPA: hypothetical protein ACMDWW_003625 [Vibrio cholerae]